MLGRVETINGTLTFPKNYRFMKLPDEDLSSSGSCHDQSEINGMQPSNPSEPGETQRKAAERAFILNYFVAREKIQRQCFEINGVVFNRAPEGNLTYTKLDSIIKYEGSGFIAKHRLDRASYEQAVQLLKEMDIANLPEEVQSYHHEVIQLFESYIDHATRIINWTRDYIEQHMVQMHYQIKQRMTREYPDLDPEILDSAIPSIERIIEILFEWPPFASEKELREIAENRGIQISNEVKRELKRYNLKTYLPPKELSDEHRFWTRWRNEVRGKKVAFFQKYGIEAKNLEEVGNPT